MKKFVVLPLISTLLLAGCMTIPVLEDNTIVKLENPTIGLNHSPIFSNNTNIVTTYWWKQFNDEQLNLLIDKVLSNNIDIKIAQLNINKVSELVNVTRSYNYPQLNLTGNVQQQKLASNAFYPPPIGGSTINFAQIGLNATYNLDLFDKVSNEIASQQLQQNIFSYKKQSLELILAVQTFKLYGYLQYLSMQENIYSKQKESIDTLLIMIKDKVKYGLGTPEEILQIENIQKNLNINFSQLKINQQTTMNALLQLAGTLNEKDIVFTANNILNHLPQPISSVNSNIITNRPDIQSYMLNIDSQKLHLKSLIADFYPSISITGDLGFQKIGLNNLLKASNLFSAIGPSIQLPIFDAKRITSNYKVAGIDSNIFIEEYNKAVLNSYYDINTNLYTTQNTFNVLKENESLYSNEKSTYSWNEKKYNIGKTSHYYLIKSKFDFLNNENQLLVSQFNYFNSYVNLINALGGTPKQ